MNQQIKKNPLLNAMFALIACAMMMMAASAHAGGGLAAGTTAVTDFKTWLYGLVGILAIIYLMVRAVMAWANKIQWIDLGMDIAKVAAAGACSVLAGWAWTIFA